jgi:hypothetical protein
MNWPLVAMPIRLAIVGARQIESHAGKLILPAGSEKKKGIQRSAGCPSLCK